MLPGLKFDTSMTTPRFRDKPEDPVTPDAGFQGLLALLAGPAQSQALPSPPKEAAPPHPAPQVGGDAEANPLPLASRTPLPLELNQGAAAPPAAHPNQAEASPGLGTSPSGEATPAEPQPAGAAPSQDLSSEFLFSPAPQGSKATFAFHPLRPEASREEPSPLAPSPATPGLTFVPSPGLPAPAEEQIPASPTPVALGIVRGSGMTESQEGLPQILEAVGQPEIQAPPAQESLQIPEGENAGLEAPPAPPSFTEPSESVGSALELVPPRPGAQKSPPPMESLQILVKENDKLEGPTEPVSPGKPSESVGSSLELVPPPPGTRKSLSAPAPAGTPEARAEMALQEPKRPASLEKNHRSLNIPPAPPGVELPPPAVAPEPAPPEVSLSPLAAMPAGPAREGAPIPGEGLQAPRSGVSTPDPVLAVSPSSARTPVTPAAGAPPAQAPPSPMPQIEGSIRWMVRHREQEAELQLHPEHLGRINISLKVEGTEVHARIWASESTTLEVLQEHRSFLQHSLQQQGLNLGSFDLQSGYRGEDARSGGDTRPSSSPRAILPGIDSVQEVPTATAIIDANPHRIELFA